MLRKRLEAFDLPFLAYLFVLSAVLLAYRHGIPESSSLLKRNAILFLFWVVFVWAGQPGRGPIIRFARNWYFCAGIPLLFTQLQFILHVVRPVDLDPLLIRLDFMIFGCHPTVWLEQIIHPWITATLQFFYVFYLPLPLPLGFYLYAKKPEAFPPFVTAVGMLFFLTMLGYFLVPAVGPRYTLAALQTVPLDGTAFTNGLIHWVNRTEGMCRDCFPSGHTGMVVLTCIFAFRLARPLLPFYLVVGSGIVLGTVYLRYHYVVDLPAGALLAFCCASAGPAFHRYVRKVLHGDPVPGALASDGPPPRSSR